MKASSQIDQNPLDGKPAGTERVHILPGQASCHAPPVGSEVFAASGALTQTAWTSRSTCPLQDCSACKPNALARAPPMLGPQRPDKEHIEQTASAHCPNDLSNILSVNKSSSPVTYCAAAVTCPLQSPSMRDTRTGTPWNVANGFVRLVDGLLTLLRLRPCVVYMGLLSVHHIRKNDPHLGEHPRSEYRILTTAVVLEYELLCHEQRPDCNWTVVHLTAPELLQIEYEFLQCVQHYHLHISVPQRL